MYHLRIFIIACGLIGQLYTVTGADDPNLTKLREAVKGLKYDDWIKEDWILKGYLDAKRGNVDAARTALEETIKWRVANKIDGVVNEIVDLHLTPPYHLTVGKDLSPVLMWAPARWDIRRIILSGQRDRLDRYFDKMLEHVYVQLRQIHSEHKNVTQAVQILDLTNYNLRQHACVACFTTYIGWLSRYESHLPGRLSHWSFINTPQIFTPLLNLLKNVMSPPTKKIFQVYESDKAKFAPVLLNYVDADKLPKVWGGTKDDFLN